MKKLIYAIILLNLLLISGCTNNNEIQKVDDITMQTDIETDDKAEDKTNYKTDGQVGSKTDNTSEDDKIISTNDYEDIGKQNSVSNTIIEDIDLSDKFDGINGCAVIYDLQNDKYSIYNTSLSKQQVSPYSTFKIISTLAGLKNGIIENEDSTMFYTGEQYPMPEWNENLTLETAFQTSCIWFFRQIIDEVGSDEIKNELVQLGYGNCNISKWEGSNINPMPDLNGFWLGSSLKISPIEQVQILKKIFEGESIYSDEDVSILKKIMLVSEDTKSIYGKTGSASNGEAWFVGFSEENGDRKYFAIYLNDSVNQNEISGSMAKEIALDILN